jgi:hypothetical protein
VSGSTCRALATGVGFDPSQLWSSPLAAFPKWLGPSRALSERLQRANRLFDFGYHHNVSDQELVRLISEVDKSEAAIEKERATKKRDFKAGVKLLRRFREGFSPDDGFNLRDVNKVKSSRVNSAIKAMRELRSQLQYPHTVVRVPKTKESRRALRQHTAQKIPKGQKLVAVHVTVPDKTKVSVSRGRVSVERQVKDGSLIELFIYLSHVMYTFDEIGDWFEEIKDSLPKGMYSLVVAKQGQIMEPMDRESVAGEMFGYMANYDARDAALDRGVPFASTVIGFRYVASTYKGMLVEQKRFKTEGEIFRDRAKRRRKEERAKIMSRLSVRERRRIERAERQEKARQLRQRKARYRAIRRVVREREQE